MPISSGLLIEEDEKSYFTSLDQLINYFDSKRIPNHQQSIINNHQQPSRRKLSSHGPQLILTHDFKGGYYEKPSQRNYSFEWLASVDIFIYFSHHRVSMPPRQWITAAKTHHTKILGTLIFESDSVQDLLLLIQGPQKVKKNSEYSDSKSNYYYINLQSPFDSISTYFADRLIDLAILHHFHGWLINIEVDLRQSIPTRAVSIVRSIKIWLEYLRQQGQARVGPDWEICWYDSVSYRDGSLSWQSSLDPEHNLPFFSASSSIFLDYHWSARHITKTQAVVNDLIKDPKSPQDLPPVEQLLSKLDLDWKRSLEYKQLSSQEDLKRSIFFGVDIYGRGCPYGGGFSSWKAASEILKAGFSVALFAPGWTWESHHLHPDRAGSKEFEPPWWNRWWRDERYLWAGLRERSIPIADKDKQDASPRFTQVETPNAYTDSLRIAAEARLPKPIKGTGYSEIPQHKALLELFPVRQNYLASSFYTNWSLGSGHGIWIEGLHHFDPVYGIGDWLDAAMSSPIHDLSIGGGRIWHLENGATVEAGMARCDSVENPGWFGSGCVEIEEQRSSSSPTPLSSGSSLKYLWLNTVALDCGSSEGVSQIQCRLVWKPIDLKPESTSSLGLVIEMSDLSRKNGNEKAQGLSKVSVFNQSSSSFEPSMIVINCPSISNTQLPRVSNIQTRSLEHGWFETTCELKSIESPAWITRVGITLGKEGTFGHHLGELSLLKTDLSNERGQSMPTASLIWEEGDSTEAGRSGTLSWQVPASSLESQPSYWLVFLDAASSPDALLAIIRSPAHVLAHNFVLNPALLPTQSSSPKSISLKQRRPGHGALIPVATWPLI